MCIRDRWQQRPRWKSGSSSAWRSARDRLSTFGEPQGAHGQDLEGAPMSQDQGSTGQLLTLYDGSHVWVRAAPLFAADDLGPRILAWFEDLAAAPVAPAAAFDPTALPVSRPALVAWILTQSDPERGIDLAWCLAHLLVAVRHAAEGLGDLVKVFAYLRASAQATAGLAPGEVVS